MKRLVAFLAVGLLVAALSAFLAPVVNIGDFLGYWSGAHVLARGGNPYDESTLEAVQRAYSTYDFVVRVWNPPWTNAIMLPLGLLSLPLARALWLLLSVGMLGAAGWWLGATFLPPTAPARLMAVSVPFGLLASWVSLWQGQINVLTLFGVAGALYFMPRLPLLAGALLVLATVKPQLAIGAIGVLGLWALARQRGAVAWAMVFFLALLLLMTALRPSWLMDYLGMESALLSYRTPTLATWAREQWPTLPTLFLFVGLAVMGFGYLAWWTWRTQRWAEGVALGVLLTMLTTPFGWSYDQIILLVPIYAVLGRVAAHRGALWVGVVGFLAINVLAVMVRLGSRDDFDLFWVPLAVALVGLASLGTLRLSSGVADVSATPPSPTL